MDSPKLRLIFKKYTDLIILIYRVSSVRAIEWLMMWWCDFETISISSLQVLHSIKTFSPLSQTSIFIDFCSHSRANDLLLESLTTNFRAFQCSHFDEQKKLCVFEGIKTIMGPNMTEAYGRFYLETRGETPFVIPDPNRFENVHFDPCLRLWC